MSFDAKQSQIRDLQLKIQELCVRSTDTNIYNANGGNGKITIGETLQAVLLVIQKDDSANALVHFDAADLTISTDNVVVTGLALAANDVAIIKYIVAE